MQKDHPGILLEDIKGKFDLVIEGHDALNRKIDTESDELKEEIGHNSFLIRTLNDKIDAVGIGRCLRTNKPNRRGEWPLMNKTVHTILPDAKYALQTPPDQHTN